MEKTTNTKIIKHSGGKRTKKIQYIPIQLDVYGKKINKGRRYKEYLFLHNITINKFSIT